ncbi:MAG: hypothetical protein AAGB93_11685 [Planctomycetota bacterium]
MQLHRALAALAALLASAVAFAPTAEARQWPEPGGGAPNRGSTASVEPPRRVPIQMWRQAFDEVLCEPVAAGGLVYATIRRGQTRRLVALDGRSGEQVASIKIAAPTFAHVSVRGSTVVVVTSAGLAVFQREKSGFVRSGAVAGSFSAPASMLEGVAAVVDGGNLVVLDLRTTEVLARTPALATKPVMTGGKNGTGTAFCPIARGKGERAGVARIALSGLGTDAPAATVGKPLLRLLALSTSEQVPSIALVDVTKGVRFLVASDRAARTTGRGLNAFFLAPETEVAPEVQKDPCVWDGVLYGRNRMGALLSQAPGEEHRKLLTRKKRPKGAVDGPITCASGVLLLGNYAYDLAAHRVLWVAPKLQPAGPLVPSGDGWVVFRDGEGALIGALQRGGSSAVAKAGTGSAKGKQKKPAAKPATKQGAEKSKATTSGAQLKPAKVAKAPASPKKAPNGAQKNPQKNAPKNAQKNAQKNAAGPAAPVPPAGNAAKPKKAPAKLTQKSPQKPGANAASGAQKKKATAKAQPKTSGQPKPTRTAQAPTNEKAQSGKKQPAGKQPAKKQPASKQPGKAVAKAGKGAAKKAPGKVGAEPAAKAKAKTQAPAPAPAPKGVRNRVAALPGTGQGIVLVDGRRLRGRVEEREGGRVVLHREGRDPARFERRDLCAIESKDGVRIVGPAHGLVLATRDSVQRGFAVRLAEVVELYARRGFPLEARRVLRELHVLPLAKKRLEEVEALALASERSDLGNREMRMENVARKEEEARQAALSQILDAARAFAASQRGLEAAAVLSYARDLWPGAFAPREVVSKIREVARPTVPTTFPGKRDDRAIDRWIAWAREIAPVSGRFARPGEVEVLGPETSPWRLGALSLVSRNLLLVSRSNDPMVVGRCLRRGEAAARILQNVLGDTPRKSDALLQVRIHRNRQDYRAEPRDGGQKPDPRSLGDYTPALGSSRFYVPSGGWPGDEPRALEDEVANLLTHQYLAERWRATREDQPPHAELPGYWAAAGLARYVEERAEGVASGRWSLASKDAPSIRAAAALAEAGELLELATFFHERRVDVEEMSRVPVVTVELGTPAVATIYSTRAIFDAQAGALVAFLLDERRGDGRRLYLQVLLDHCRNESGDAIWKELGFETSGALEGAFRDWLTAGTATK